MKDNKVKYKYVKIKNKYKVSIKELALIIESFPKKQSPFPKESYLEKKLYKTYLSYQNLEEIS